MEVSAVRSGHRAEGKCGFRVYGTGMEERQSRSQYLFDPARIVDGYAVGLSRCEILLDILPVFRGQNHVLNPSSPRSKELLLDAADGQDVAAKSDLTGHSREGTDRSIGHQRHQSRYHRDACRRAVLGDGSCWHMDVKVHVRIEVFLQSHR